MNGNGHGNLNPILLVDDSARDLDVMVAWLHRIPLANPIVTLRDGEEALAYLNAHCRVPAHVQPVAVLLDIKMPKVNGLEVLQAMKTDPDLQRIPVVMVTSSRESPDIVESYKLGANAYVVKPVDFEEFFQAVREIGRFWAVVNQPPVISTASATAA